MRLQINLEFLLKKLDWRFFRFSEHKSKQVLKCLSKHKSYISRKNIFINKKFNTPSQILKFYF